MVLLGYEVSTTVTSLLAVMLNSLLPVGCFNTEISLSSEI